MKTRSLLVALTVMFILGVAVGCVLFMLFQSYIFIMALVGLITLISKSIPTIAKTFIQNQKEES